MGKSLKSDVANEGRASGVETSCGGASLANGTANGIQT